MMELVYWVLGIFLQLFYFLFFSIWGWIILLIVVVPAVRGRLRTWGRRRAFYRARQAELANPRNASARFQLGVIHYDGRQLRRALSFFEEAVRISEGHDAEVDPKLFQYLGHTLRRLGHHREAVAAYEAGLAEAPDSGRGDSECGIGLAHQRLGSIEEALEWYRRAMDRNHSLLEAKVRLAALLTRLGRTEEAQAVLEDARSTRLPDFAHRRQRRWRLALAVFPVARLFL